MDRIKELIHIIKITTNNKPFKNSISIFVTARFIADCNIFSTFGSLWWNETAINRSEAFDRNK